MIMTLAGGFLTALALVQQTDTTFAVEPGTRLNVSNFGGGIAVRAWNRNEVRIVANHSRREQIVVDRERSEIRVRSAGWRQYADQFDIRIEGHDHIGIHMQTPRRPTIIDYEITAPASTPLILGGPYTDVFVEGTRGEVSVKVNEGDVSIRGGTGRVNVQTVEGTITVTGAEGNIRLVSVDGRITVENARGDLFIEATDGNVRLVNTHSANVDVFSVDGNIWFSGIVQDGGRYTLGTHDGDITLHVPRTTNARVTVATFDGDFSTDFPVTLPERARGHRYTFSLGSGSAEVDVEAFNGHIRLRHLEGDTRPPER